ncbi:MAG: hypothetical protein VX496_06155, partial [Planctomycetota bacterium]|nr:hypothetical protein [Planctomycetota bacterium]
MTNGFCGFFSLADFKGLDVSGANNPGNKETLAMNRMYLRAFVATLCIVVAGQCQAQELGLSFDGSCGTEATLAPGAVQAVSIDCVLTTSNNPLDSGA